MKTPYSRIMDFAAAPHRAFGPGRVFALVVVWLVACMTLARANLNYLSPPWRADTFAGYVGSGGEDGPAASATFFEPAGLALDSAGVLYIADARNSAVRKLSAGQVSTVAGVPGVAGVADGVGSGARFNLAYGVAAAADGTLYVADTENHLVRRIASNGQVTTLAGTAGQTGSTDGVAAAARFKSPAGLVLDEAAGVLYVADTLNHTIRRVTLANGQVATLAGAPAATGSVVDGTGPAARFHAPVALALNSSAGELYVADSLGHTLRRITLAGGHVTILAGAPAQAGAVDGSAPTARFDEPKGLAFDAAAGALYVADSNGCLIRRVRVSDGFVSTLAGAHRDASSVDGVGAAARFSQPVGLAFAAAARRLYVADALGAQLRALDVDTRTAVTLAGPPPSRGVTDGPATSARFNRPQHVARDSAGNLYVADTGNHTLRKISPAGIVTTLAGSPGVSDTVDGTGSVARFNQPCGVAVLPNGSVIYVSELGGHVIRRVTAAGVVTTLAGLPYVPGDSNGTGAAARFQEPAGLALDANGNLYVADFGNHLIRRVTPAGVVTTIAGSSGLTGSTNGVGAAARFWGPYGLATDAVNQVYVADFYNQTVRKITTSGSVSTFAGAAGQVGAVDSTGSSARFFYPAALAVDSSGSVYVADYANHLVRRITSAGVVRTLAGSPGAAGAGAVDGLANAARFRNPRGIAVEPSGARVFLSDTENNAVRTIEPVPVPVITSAPTASGRVGEEFAGYQITANHSPLAYGATGLPAGLLVDPASGAIVGTPLQAGVFNVTLTAENLAGLGTSILVLTVAKAPAIITLSNLEQPFDGQPKSPAATTIPPGLAVTFTFNGLSTAPSAFGDYNLVASVSHPDYASTVTAVFRIAAPRFWSLTSPPPTGASLAGPAALALGPDGALYIADGARHVVFRRAADGTLTVFAGALDQAGYVNATATAARLREPSGLVFDTAGNLYVADTGNHAIRRINVAGVVTHVAGGAGPADFDSFDGTGAGARFYRPLGLALAPDGSLIVADSGNLALRRISLPGAVVTTLPWFFNQPSGVAVDAAGVCYVSEADPFDGNRIWRAAAGQAAVLLAGSAGALSGSTDGFGTAARFSGPRGLALGPDGGLYVADTFNHLLRKIIPSTGEVLTLAGAAGSSGTTDGFGPAARMSAPSALAFAADGSLWLADTDNARVRLALPPPILPTLVPQSFSLVEGRSVAGAAFIATGSPTYFAVTGLPLGLVLNQTTGAITGTPLQSGVYTVTVRAGNVLGEVASDYVLTISPPAWSDWLVTHFSPAQRANPAIAGSAADPDGDGRANLWEYAAGTSPWTVDGGPAINTSWSAGTLTLSGVRLRAASGLRWVPEVSSDLAVWTRSDTRVESTPSTPLDARSERYFYRLNVAASSRLFLRLTLEVHTP